jgi:hypothetical protein
MDNRRVSANDADQGRQGGSVCLGHSSHLFPLYSDCFRKRDSAVAVTASGQWTVRCPGIVSGQAAFDKGEVQDTNF